jgi:hypothetical protein
MGGPSESLTPAFLRRTVYGKIGRYKLDEYLQLFDFPSPAISAEKRFTTTVPLQRLFLMNSDFMQIEAEELAKRVATEPDNRTRIRKLYQITYGRDATESEVAVALDYLKSEPMLEYDEFKSKKSATSIPAHDIKPTNNNEPTNISKTASDAAKPPDANAEPAPTAADMPPDMPAASDQPEEGDAPDAGMMAGVPGFGGRRSQANNGPKTPEYTPTPLGRYAKVLLSSSEFMFIN